MRIEELLDYLSSVIENRPGTERWSSWWARHRHSARLALSADEFKALEAGPSGIWKIARAHGLQAKPRFLPLARDPMEIPAEWLVAPIDLRKAESAIALERRDEWEYVKRHMQPGDEVWQYVATPERQAAAGFALVRRGVPYDGIFLGFTRRAT